MSTVDRMKITKIKIIEIKTHIIIYIIIISSIIIYYDKKIITQ